MSTRAPRLLRPFIGQRLVKRSRNVVLFALAAAALVRCGHRTAPPAPPWARSDLPVGVRTGGTSARADVAALEAGGRGQPWLAGGATVDARRWTRIPLPAQAPAAPERLEVAATRQAVAIVVRATAMAGLWWAPLGTVA